MFVVSGNCIKLNSMYKFVLACREKTFWAGMAGISLYVCVRVCVSEMNVGG